LSIFEETGGGLPAVGHDRSLELTVAGSTGQMRAHPLLASAALQVTALDILVRGLALPIGDESVGRRRSPSAREAAQARWRNGAA
jgi:hypothetical protein